MGTDSYTPNLFRKKKVKNSKIAYKYIQNSVGFGN